MKIQISSLALFLLAIMIMFQNDVVSAENEHRMMMSQNNVVLGRKDQKLIETTCRNTPDYKLCIAVITADPGSQTKDLPGLALVVVAEIKKKAQEVMAKIANLEKTGAKELKKPLAKCRDNYNAVLVGDVPEAESAVRGNPKFAETAMADTKIEADMCEGAFKGVAPSPLTKENKYVADVAAVARGIIRNLL